MSHPIYPCIWCHHNAKEVAEFYCATFPNTHIIDENPVVVMLSIEGQKLMLLNGGVLFKPNPSISLMVLFDKAEEVEELYTKLMQGGAALMPLDEYPFSKKYAWVQDKFGVSWQLYMGETGGAKQKYVPTMMFIGENAGKAKEAISFYTMLFPNSRVQGILEYPEGGPDKPGLVMHAQFDIDGYTLMCMDSSYEHHLQFTEGMSLVVSCKNQEEIDYYWNSMTANGGAESRCGWLKDKYGVSWQIIPENIASLLQAPHAMDALMKMNKIVIADLKNAKQ